MSANARTPGSRTAWRAQNADRVIRMTEQLVSALGSSQADLAPAHEVLSAAKALYVDRDYSEAVAQAKRAEALAASLNARFDGYMAAWKELEACREELERLGLPTDDLEAVLGAAEKRMAQRVDEDGSPVPDYLGAAELLTQAAASAREAVGRARLTSRGVLLASIAVESLSGAQPTGSQGWLGLRLEELIEQATREFALGNLAAADRLASEAKHRADEAHVGGVRSWARLEEAAKDLERLRAEGPAAETLAKQIAAARDALAQGFLDPTTAQVVVDRLSREVASFADRYAQALGSLERAERVYGRLQEEGFSSYEVDRALSEARHALGTGDWSCLKESIRRATESFLRRRKERDAIARSIAGLQVQVSALDGAPVPLLPDIRELLARAEQEFRHGRFSGANEDLLLATALMRQSVRSGS